MACMYLKSNTFTGKHYVLVIKTLFYKCIYFFQPKQNVDLWTVQLWDLHQVAGLEAARIWKERMKKSKRRRKGCPSIASSQSGMLVHTLLYKTNKRLVTTTPFPHCLTFLLTICLYWSILSEELLLCWFPDLLFQIHPLGIFISHHYRCQPAFLLC